MPPSLFSAVQRSLRRQTVSPSHLRRVSTCVYSVTCSHVTSFNIRTLSLGFFFFFFLVDGARSKKKKKKLPCVRLRVRDPAVEHKSARKPAPLLREEPLVWLFNPSHCISHNFHRDTVTKTPRPPPPPPSSSSSEGLSPA